MLARLALETANSSSDETASFGTVDSEVIAGLGDGSVATLTDDGGGGWTQSVHSAIAIARWVGADKTIRSCGGGSVARLDEDGGITWQVDIEGGSADLHALAVDGDGNTYVGVEDDAFTGALALDPDGAELWRTALETRGFRAAHVHGSLLYMFGSGSEDGGTVYGRLCRTLDIADGTVVDEYHDSGDSWNQSLWAGSIDPNGNAYISSGGSIRQVSPSMAEQWRTSLPDAQANALSYLKKGVVVVGVRSNGVKVLDASDGSEVDAFTTGDSDYGDAWPDPDGDWYLTPKSSSTLRRYTSDLVEVWSASFTANVNQGDTFPGVNAMVNESWAT